MGKISGVYHFLADSAPKKIPMVAPKPRKINLWQKEGRPVVTKVEAGEDIKKSVADVLSLLGGLDRLVQHGDSVFIKPNFNSDDPFSASTDVSFLRAVIEILRDIGAKVTVGEWSGVLWQPTRRVMRNLGIEELANDLGVELIAFDEHPDDWVNVKIDGKHLESVPMPRSAYEADKMIYLPCMKTHKWARYTGALKLPFGFVHLAVRRDFHARYLEEKLAEVNLCWQADLIIKDGRKAFVSGGPANGELVTPGIVLASGDPVAIDVEGVRLLLSYKADNLLTKDPWQLPIVATALEHGLGRRDYIVVE
jgi:uncharacterized protein (DUF362 family)